MEAWFSPRYADLQNCTVSILIFAIIAQGIIAENVLKVDTINGVPFGDLMVKNSNLDNVVMTGKRKLSRVFTNI